MLDMDSDKKLLWHGTYCMHGAWINLSALSLGTGMICCLLGV